MTSFVLAAAVLVAMALSPGIARAEVYKCQAAGKVVYQDSPCKGAPTAPPYLADGQTRRVDDIGPGLSMAALRQLIRDDARKLEELEGQYHRQAAAIDARAKALSREQWQSARLDLAKAWSPRMRDVRDHQRRAMDELRRRCPSPSSSAACGP